MSPQRKLGCFTIGFIWAVIVVLTIVGGAIGDCFEPGCKQAIYVRTWRIVGVEMLVLAAIGWFFYVGETRD
jgi:hypothetical protein